MKNYLFNISEEERNNILDKHKSLYDGYAVKQTVSNTQPLYVQDFANDKEGITVNSKGDVSSYNNKIYMKEDFDVSKLEKGKKYKYKTPSFEDELEFDKETDYPHSEKMYTFKGEKEHGHHMGKKHAEDFLSDIDEEKNVCSECGMSEEVCECGKGGMYETECKECGGMMEEGECSECGYKQVGKFGKHFDYVEEDEKSDKVLSKLSKGLDKDLEMEEGECMECGKGMYDEEWKEGVEFEEDIEKIKESIQESLDWFKKFKKYN